MLQSIRTGVYALILHNHQALVALKGRGPFTGSYDLPWGKIEHGERNQEALKREIIEETGLEHFEIEKILWVSETFVKHISSGVEKDEHLIQIVYLVTLKDLTINYDHQDPEGDARGLLWIDLEDITTPKTEALEKALEWGKNICNQISSMVLLSNFVHSKRALLITENSESPQCDAEWMHPNLGAS